MAKIVKKTELMGSGCAVQALGLLAFPLGGALLGRAGLVAGGLIGLTLLVIGGRMAISWRCDQCGNEVPDKGVKVCATCKARFA